MRFAPFALLAWAASALAHPPPHDLRPPPSNVLTAPQRHAMTCTDTRDAHDHVVSTACEVTSLVPAEVHELERRSEHFLQVFVRRDARQADFDTLAAAPFLTYISIDSAFVTKLGALAKFDKLVTLGIDLAAAADLPQLANAPVQALTIGGSGKLADLEPVASLVSLQTLYVGGGPGFEIGKLDGIEKLPKLASFESFATIGDAWALAKSTSIRNLMLLNGPIPLDAIAHMKLEQLSLNLIHATDAELDTFEHLANLDGLTNLDISMEREPRLPKLPKLINFRLQMFGVDRETVDLAFVRTLPNLEAFAVQGAQRADLAPLAALRKLADINVSSICHVDAAPIAKLPTLKSLLVSPLAEHVPIRRGLYTYRTGPYAGCTPDHMSPPAAIAN